MAGKLFWSLGKLLVLTGTLPKQSLSFRSTAVPAGYYAATNLTNVDPNLAPANVKQGATVFGVAGSFTGDATAAPTDIAIGKTAYVDGVRVTGRADPAPVAKTGQMWCVWASTWQPGYCPGTPAGQDGEVQRGVPFPTPRFTDNGDGTVTDNLTGLVWLRNASCGGQLPAGEYTVKYRLRVNMAGTFRVGPATVQSMYAPEFAAYSSGAVLTVRGE